MNEWRWRMRKCAPKNKKEDFIIIIITKVSQDQDSNINHTKSVNSFPRVRFFSVSFSSTLHFGCKRFGTQITFRLIKRQLFVCMYRMLEESVWMWMLRECWDLLSNIMPFFAHSFRIQSVIVVQSIKIFALVSTLVLIVNSIPFGLLNVILV